MLKIDKCTKTSSILNVKLVKVITFNVSLEILTMFVGLLNMFSGVLGRDFF